MMVGDHSHVCWWQKNSCRDSVLPHYHGELAGSCASINLGIFGGLAFLVLQNLPLPTSVNRFAWRNKFLMNGFIEFQKDQHFPDTQFDLPDTGWMQLG